MSDLFDILETSSEVPTLTTGEKGLLEDKIRDAREHYYNGTPIMSDAEYDVLEQRLRELDPSNVLLEEVGVAAPQQGTWPKAEHKIPMGSLDKVMPNDKITSGSKVGPGIKEWWAKTEAALRG